MSYRPITDTWILARPKVKYYGAYPSGFLVRARALLGVMRDDPVLHVCSGRVEDYPFDGFGENDYTVDIDPDLKPDFVMDVTKELPLCSWYYDDSSGKWPAILADPPYTQEDAAHYAVPLAPLPNPRKLLKDCIDAVCVGGRVGFLHYCSPRPPKNARLVAMVGVTMGYDNNWRSYTVYERTA